MKKLQLRLDELAAETFAVADAGPAGGTVAAHEDVITPKCVYTDPAATCWCTERDCP